VKKIDTPECNKMLAVKGESHAIGQFIDWLLNDKGVVLAKWHSHGGDCRRGRRCGIYAEQPVPWCFRMEELLAEYFGIDLHTVERERRAVLDALREHNGPSSSQG
jgi:hypothetical protein